MSLNYWLDNYITDPRNQEINFNLGWEYEKMGQTASAAGYYLRSVEFGKDNSKIYEALLRISLCFEKQGNRVFTIKGILLRAISVLPKRPEAHFLLSRIYERNKDWQEGYTAAMLGYEFATDEPNTKTDVEYPGKWAFIFEKAVCGWWVGLYDESISLFRSLQSYNMPSVYADSVKRNLDQLGSMWKEPLLYHKGYYEQLRYKFNEAHLITRNYSQCYQDMFALCMTNGKQHGTYLEIGSADPFYGNNTALLEEMGWRGVSVDIDANSVKTFNEQRENKAIQSDATKLDYSRVLEEANFTDVIDYLQIDCDPPAVSYEVLTKIPFWDYKFRVITFEHDAYVDPTGSIREKSRKYLESHGYVLAVRNIAPDKYSAYEDWWVHPDLVDTNILQRMLLDTEDPKKADDYMLNNL